MSGEPEPEAEVAPELHPIPLMDGHPFCGNSHNDALRLEMAAAATNLSRWPSGVVTYSFAAYVKAIGRDMQRQLTQNAFALVQAVCGVRVTEIEDPSQANIVFNAGRGSRMQFDGPGGTLAYAYLPVGDNPRQCPVYFDLDENWAAVAGGGQSNAIILFLPVDIHEGAGHALGLPHTPTVDRKNIMNAIYNPNQLALGPWDIEQYVLRYGEPANVPPGINPARITVHDLLQPGDYLLQKA